MPVWRVLWRLVVGAHRCTQLRAWQTCTVYKNAVYQLCAVGPLSTDWPRRRQLEEAVADPPSHISAGFGRCNRADFAGFVVLAHSSLMESRSHLRDAVDKGYITEAVRLEHDRLAEAALKEVTGLMECLQSPEALRNARHPRERSVTSGDHATGSECPFTKKT